MSDRIAPWLVKAIDQGWLLPVTLSVAFFLNLGGAPLFDLDEGAFSAATWEMLQRGDFITTYLNGEPRFDKPILIYWLQAISVSLFGLHEWALRLPSAIAASLWAVAVMRFARQFLGAQAGTAAAVFTATATAVLVIGRAATADALLNLFIALILLDAYRYVASPEHSTLLRVYAWMGLGVLTKGPVAVVIPLVVSFLYFAWGRDYKTFLRVVFQPLGWLILLAIAAPWYILEYRDQGQAFIDGFIFRHNLGRFSDTMEGHGGQVYYYLIMVPLILLPFTGLLLRVLRRIREALVPSLDRWLWLWFGFVFVFFSFSGTQLPHYVLYGATPLFLLMAKYREDLRSRWLAFAPPIALFVLLLILPSALEAYRGQEKNLFIQSMLEPVPQVMGLGYHLAVATGLGLVIGVAAWRRLRPWQGLLGVGLLQATVMVLVVLPAWGQIQQGPIRQAALFARDIHEPIVMWGINMPSFTVYRGAVTPVRVPQAGEVVVTRVNKLGQLAGAEVLFEQGGIVLARLPKVSPRPEATAPGHDPD